eukprot:CAMPEP_0119143776 /NCGR_PEP_ID=MMETSP1310-20130426/34820_1 /TAXON_ID=464262 /ORGANISM="Genus nov. species nov., Strain RCC2339" /LENGTH=357 /DNA_ID=CAMNT_0007135439 /DNA_START=84 /DNA_END=1157 /DNA_ORIENTATION=+
MDIDFTFKRPDHTDQSWYDSREIGHPDDPYNKNCRKLEKSDPRYEKYLDIGRRLCDELEKDATTGEEDGWILVQEKDGVTTHKKENEGDALLTFRGFTVIPSTPEIIRLWLIQLDQRKYWDPTFEKASYELEAEVTARAAYNLYTAPWPVSWRDFFVIGSESIREGGLFVAGVHSVEDDEFPPQEGYVRGTIYSSGFVIKPLPPKEDGTPQCKVWYTGTVDPAGWLPTYVANLVGSEQPMNLGKLRDLIVDVADIIMDVFKVLFKEEEWTQNTIRAALDSTLAKYGYDDKPELLYDAFKNYYLGQRVGPTDEELLSQMEKEGKTQALAKLFKTFQHYIVSLPGGKDLFDMAENYFKN